MRRGIRFSKKAYIFLALTAFFNLLAIVFDQLVVQQEDNIRDFDHIINENRQEVHSNLYAHKVFNELMFKVHFSASDLITNLNYLTRVIHFLNGDLPKKIEKDNINNIREVYIKKTKDIVRKFEDSKNDTKLIFYKIIEDPSFIKFINKERPPDLFDNPYYFLSEAKQNIERKYKNNFLSNYNFKAETTDEQSANYPIYLKLYDDLLKFNRLKNTFDDLSNGFKKEFRRNYSVYYLLLAEYAAINNLKNYLILLSILFQIIGLVTLVILFRVLIEENK